MPPEDQQQSWQRELFRKQQSTLSRQRTAELAQSNKFRAASRIAATAAAGGLGRVASREIERRIGGRVRESGERAAERWKARRGQNPMPPPKEKLAGWIFWFIFLLSLVNELLDIFLGITIILSVFTWITGIIITFAIGFYLVMEGVNPSTRKLALWLISIIIEAIPFLNMLPTYPFSLLIMKHLEYREFQQQKIQFTESRQQKQPKQQPRQLASQPA